MTNSQTHSSILFCKFKKPEASQKKSNFWVSDEVGYANEKRDCKYPVFRTTYNLEVKFGVINS